MIKLTLMTDAPAESGFVLPKGAVVEYLGHVIGGMVRVKYKGHEYVIHPANTKELQ